MAGKADQLGQGDSRVAGDKSNAKGFNSAYQDFTTKLGEFNPQFFDVGQMLLNRGLSGEEDPLIAMQRGQALEANRGAMARTGVGGSVALNQLGRVNQGYDQASLARNDTLLQSGFGLQQQGLQNLLAPPALQTAQTAAENAGKGGGGGGGKGGK